ncbi:LysR substrate-binding domain-containing protein [Hydrogenimonas thermophila]|uniref:DNA-binding transcriptional regulator, LysR family n=1 Tax=Hydrogenimonas thermophila TaxID=223786 RepID=A0A1I5MY72_9BACT|nr:LysR substrate-binding domain-containing protein [Hydrogenimonas thermophila]SFP14473.1 DNA-binding transcriptional regulator, LysR family [Hydrogenimonas thermophila]
MTLKELELFYYLADNPHISQLAKQLSMSQSAISLAIKSLEKKLSEPLFDRVGKKLVLNERGRLFKEKTYNHFLALKDAENFFKEDRLSGNLHIISSKTVGDFIMPQVIFDFLSHYPNAKICKDIKNSTDIVKSILEGSIDMGFVEFACSDPNIIKERVGRDQLIVVSSDKNLSEKEFYIDQLFSKKWLLREKGSGTRDVFLKTLGDLAKDINIFMEFSEFEEIKTLLERNPDAITCISKFSVKKELERGELFEVKLKNITFERDFCLVYHKNKYKSKLFNEFSEFAKRYFQNILENS